MAGLDGMTICDRIPRLDSPEDLFHLDKYLGEHKPDVAFFDPVYLALGGADAGNVLSMGERLGNINRTCAEHGTTPILLHHMKRGRTDPYEPGELSDLAWSGFAEFAAQWLLLSRRAKYTPSPDAQHELWLSIGGRHGHGGVYGLDVSEGITGSDVGRYWAPEVIDAADIQERKQGAIDDRRQERMAENLRADRMEIVTLFSKLDGRAETKKATLTRASIGRTRFDKAWQSLIDDGTIIESEDGVPKGKGQHYKGWTLNDSEGEE